MGPTLAGAAGIEPDVQLTPHERRLAIVFWWLFALSTAVLLPSHDPPVAADLPLALKIAASPFVWLAVWLSAHALRRPARGLVGCLPRPVLLRFVLVAALAGIALAVHMACGMEEPLGGRIGPRLTTAAGCFGVFMVAMAGWYLIRRIYAFHHHHVFWIGGLMFALFDQGQGLSYAWSTADYLGGVLLLAHTIPVFGVPFGIVFLLMPREDLPRPDRSPGWFGFALLTMVPVLVYVAWAPLWFRVLDLATWPAV